MIIQAKKEHEQLLLDFARQEASWNIFIIGDILIYGFDQPFQTLFMRCENDQLKGIAVRYYDAFVVYDTEGAPEWAECMVQENGMLVQGKEKIVKAIAQHLPEAVQITESFFCQLITAEHLQAPSDNVRLGTLADIPSIVAGYIQIEEFSSLYSTEDTGRLTNMITQRIAQKEGRHFLLMKDGVVAAHANSAAESDSHAIIGGVFTLPKYRQQTLAMQTVNALCVQLRQEHKMPCLFYHNENAGRLYHKLGFETIGKWSIAERKGAENE